MASISDIGKGDFVKVGQAGIMKEIEEIKIYSTTKFGRPKRWEIVTVDGERVDMWSARAYHKKSEAS